MYFKIQNGSLTLGKNAILVISNSQDGSRTIDNAALRLVESFRFNNKNQDKDNL